MGLVSFATTPPFPSCVTEAFFFSHFLLFRHAHLQRQDEKYKILNVLEFNSTRKRMSVIVQDERGNIKLYCKGADSVIFERLSPNQPFKEATVQHLREFASDGLRTLCLAVVQLKREEYEEWSRVS